MTKRCTGPCEREGPAEKLAGRCSCGFALGLVRRLDERPLDHADFLCPLAPPRRSRRRSTAYQRRAARGGRVATSRERRAA